MLFVQLFYKRGCSQLLQLIDHNLSATTATSSFHGTDISIFQHPLSTDVTNSPKIEFDSQKPKSKAISCLPESYTNVKPAFLKSKPSPPILNTPLVIPDHDYLFRNLRLEYEWLDFVSLTNEVLDMETVSWSAYHSSKRRGPQVNVSISSTPVMACDQPLFVLANQIKWE